MSVTTARASLTSLASLEHISSREAYPRKMVPVVDEGGLEPPLALLPGEHCRYLGSTGCGLALLTNYRAVFCRQKALACGDVVVALGLVESVESRDMFNVFLLCKDGQSHALSFTTNEYCSKWLARLKECILPAKTFGDYFACAYRAWQPGDEGALIPGIPLGEGGADGVLCGAYSFGEEITRLGFDTAKVWRITQGNTDYELCNSYPDEMLVPRTITDPEVKESASFRSMGRFPVVVWRSRHSGAVLARASQPQCGLLAWRSIADERLLAAITDCAVMNASNSKAGECESGLKRLQIIDARAFSHAVFNRAKGGGIEFPEYYPNSDSQFMGLPNIHCLRKSFRDLRSMLFNSASTPDLESASWLSQLDGTRWIYYLSLLLRTASIVVEKLQQPHCVLVHCSDGWDRTPQVVSLTQLLMDPYYRTFKGFQCLIEKDWLAYGHKFADRCGHVVGAVDQNEVSPVFLQWLDCVYQIHLQHPCAFEFSEQYLVKLAEHTYSCMFGTFLLNKRNRTTVEAAKGKTLSVWAYLDAHKQVLRNVLYSPGSTPEVLKPSWYTRDLHLWRGLYHPSAAPALSSAVLGGPHAPHAASMPCSVMDSSLPLGMAQSRTTGLLPGAVAMHQSSLPGNRWGAFSRAHASDDWPSIHKHGPDGVPARRRQLSENGTSTTEGHVESARGNSSAESAGDRTVYENEPAVLDASGPRVQRPDFVGMDGLLPRTSSNDVVLRRLMETEDLVRYLEHRVESLQSRLSHRLRNGRVPSDEILLPQPCSSAAYSQDSASSGGSGGESEGSSWEDVDSREINVTMWVPDDQVSHCCGCSRVFSYSRRKHHCRNCGNIYCSECAHDYMPLPKQLLYSPVRVCTQCHQLCQPAAAGGSETACKDAALLESTATASGDNQVSQQPLFVEDRQTIVCST